MVKMQTAYNGLDPKARLKIIKLEPDKEDIVIEAQFNPKEIQWDTTVSYSENNGHLEFTSKSDPRSSMAFEMFFDGFEKKESVVPAILALQSLTKRMKSTGDDARPPKVRIIWGASTESMNLPSLTAVVESVSVKYQMFTPDGLVLRATANVKVKEAGSFRVGKKK